MFGNTPVRSRFDLGSHLLSPPPAPAWQLFNEPSVRRPFSSRVFGGASQTFSSVSLRTHQGHADDSDGDGLVYTDEENEEDKAFEDGPVEIAGFTFGLVGTESEGTLLIGATLPSPTDEVRSRMSDGMSGRWRRGATARLVVYDMTERKAAEAEPEGNRMHFLPNLSLLGLLTLTLAPIITNAGSTTGCSASRKRAVRKVRFRVSYSPLTLDSITISSESGGGGPRATIPSTSTNGLSVPPGFTNPFVGREYAGGDRSHIYGTRAYGSGYPYGADDSSSLRGRPFPHGMWPISWGPEYLGGGEYWGEDVEFMRPGGSLGLVNVATEDTTEWPGVGKDEVYWMIGDKESLVYMTSKLVDACYISPAWARRFDPASSTATNGSTTNSIHVLTAQPRPENVIQYYRSSSFALAYPSYNNTFALTSSNPSTAHDSTPLPDALLSSAFLKCVNETIGSTVPIADSLANDDGGLSAGAIAGIVFACIFGIAVIYVCCSTVFSLDFTRSRAGKKRRREQTQAQTGGKSKKGDKDDDDETIKMLAVEGGSTK
ncbi:hypothetical protein FRC17_001299 [Serendipita sp. 399]|nr:hypothetical protein FRC17_001299 [Serendipita sp. 399]